MLIQMPDKLMIFEFPYSNPYVESNNFLASPFIELEGLFLPVLAGSS